MLSRIISNKDGVKVTLKCLVFNSVFNDNVGYDFFALIDNGESIRSVYPQKLSAEQRKMSVDEYVNHGRCEFFKHVRPNHLLSLIGESCNDPKTI